MSSRVVTLERDRDFVFEVIRKRPVSPDYCRGLSDNRRACTTDQNRICGCRFYVDQQDVEFQMLTKLIAEQLDAEQKAQRAASGDLQGNPPPEED